MIEKTPKLESTDAELSAQIQQLQKQRRQLRSNTAPIKRVEFSKLIFLGVSVVTIAITVFSCIMIWRTMDTAALAYLIPAVFAEMAAATGFYYTKAKVENKIKLMARHNVKPEATNFDE